jgi:hypothetical protein
MWNAARKMLKWCQYIALPEDELNRAYWVTKVSNGRGET